MSLGTGVYDVYLSDRGGGALLGKIPGVSSLRWGRVRDDVSKALLHVEEPTRQCASLLQEARSIRHELVITRNGHRVWEGPITRIEYANGRIEVGADDVLWFATHRVLSQGFDWSNKTADPDYHGENVVQKLLPMLQSVYGNGATDPNGYQVGKFLMPIYGPEDPKSTAVVASYSRTVWEVLDQFAEDGGIDYTVVGRRILWHDVHLRAFELQRMTDADFNSALVVTEYGTDLETRRFRTDNAGNVTYSTAPQAWLNYYGPVDSVISNVDEEASGVVQDKPSSPVKADLGSVYPAPLRLRMPENTGLSCDANVDINDLIPGVWVPVTSTLTARPVEQWMKLDAVNVEVGGDGAEVVNVTMSQAPAGAVVPA